jgi:hypothetical protein
MNSSAPILRVVHCIDTEGPLYESLDATFERINRAFGVSLAPDRETLSRLQRREVPLGGLEDEVARMVKPELIAYNADWAAVDAMLDDAMSRSFRHEMIDDFGGGWVYSWHCLDHVGITANPRRKAVGYGVVFRHYRERTVANGGIDEINWHFHPLSIDSNPLAFATSYANNAPLLLEMIARRIVEDGWFPVVNRPGFHAERPDSHAFLEQWIPFDYASQSGADPVTQPDISGGRAGDWRRAPELWGGYHPAHDDHQRIGACRRTIYRCLNLGTRLRQLTQRHVDQAFEQARTNGDAILAFADHDFRDIRPDVRTLRQMLINAKARMPDIKIRFSGAEAAARESLARRHPLVPDPKLELTLDANILHVRSIGGPLFGPQPFLAILDRQGRALHDNFDFQDPGRYWTYVFDDQTIPLDRVARIGVGSAGLHGRYCVATIAP